MQEEEGEQRDRPEAEEETRKQSLENHSRKREMTPSRRNGEREEEEVGRQTEERQRQTEDELTPLLGNPNYSFRVEQYSSSSLSVSPLSFPLPLSPMLLISAGLELEGMRFKFFATSFFWFSTLFFINLFLC